jgi:hypothetical protein
VDSLCGLFAQEEKITMERILTGTALLAGALTWSLTTFADESQTTSPAAKAATSVEGRQAESLIGIHKSTFNKIDLNQDGILSKQEAWEAEGDAQLEALLDSLTEKWTSVDQDGSGTVSLAEFGSHQASEVLEASEGQ